MPKTTTQSDRTEHLFLDDDGNCFLRLWDEDGNSTPFPLGFIGFEEDPWGPAELSFPEFTDDYRAEFVALRAWYRAERMVGCG